MNVSRLLLATVIALDLSACVEARTPLVTQTQPAVGQQFELNLYEGFKDGRAQDFHTAVYQWKDGRYIRAGGLARDVKSLAAEPLGRDDLILQRDDFFPASISLSQSSRRMWTTRRAMRFAKGIRQITCTITAHEQLVTLAQATAAKPLRNPALGVVMQK